MDIHQQAKKAARLRELHHGANILLIANAWDVASARILEDLGLPAIATSSAAVAFALGYPDGQRISRDEMLDMVSRIASAVRVPVTADMEAGYGTILEHMADTAKAVVAAGAVGLNIEDVTGSDETSHIDTALQMEKIRTIHKVSTSLGVPLVINARTDIYLMPIGPAETRFARTVERLRAYREAGADCLFAPGVKDAETMAKLVKAVDAPLNVLITTGSPSLKELEKIGVARASTGSGTMRAAMGALRRVGKELLETGTYSSLLDGAVPFAELNSMFERNES